MINIEIINSKLHVASKYNQKLVGFMRNQPGRFWDANKREWVIPESSMPGLLNLIDDIGEKYNIVNRDEATHEHIPIPTDYAFKTEPYKHQIDGIEYGLDHNKFLLADEQGCIDGDMIVKYGVSGAIRTVPLSELYRLYSKSHVKEKYTIWCLKNGVFGQHPIKNVVYSGDKDVFSVRLDDGKSVNATADHKILTDRGYIEVCNLKIGDTIITNGTAVCKKCGLTVIVIPKESKVVSITHVGIKPTYDISMCDPYHNFIANGIVVHNCGKTKQVIDLANIHKKIDGFKHVLVIACVNGLKYNWRKEVSVHSDESGYILGTRYTKKGREYIGSNQDRLDDLKSIGTGSKIDENFFIITNIETLRYSKSVQVPMKRKKNGEVKYKKQTTFPIVDEINRLIKDGLISMVVVDEMHRCFSYDTKILTDIGFMNIGDVVNSRNRLVATRSDTGSIDFVKPSNYFKNPISNLMFELTVMLSSGHIKTIVCTPDHMFLTENRGYVSANELSENDILVEGEIE